MDAAVKGERNGKKTARGQSRLHAGLPNDDFQTIDLELEHSAGADGGGDGLSAVDVNIP